MRRVLVTGGGGYIGAHVCRTLAGFGDEPVVLDDFSSGHRSAVLWGELIEGSILDPKALAKAFSKPIDAVIHLAAKALVGESVEMPALYYEHNVVGTKRLIEAMEKAGTNKIIFSSTCAIYGETTTGLLHEKSCIDPKSPYASSKWMAEELIRRSSLSHVIFRYFNAAGASSSGEIGEDHTPETHLIPRAIRCKLEGKKLPIYGTQWPTPDGTCLRDYIHVDDIAAAHKLALDVSENLTLNLGTGKGYSVREIAEMIGVETVEKSPRKGDVAALVCDGKKALEKLGFTPSHSNLRHIIDTAYAWEEAREKRAELEATR